MENIYEYVNSIFFLESTVLENTPFDSNIVIEIKKKLKKNISTKSPKTNQDKKILKDILKINQTGIERKTTKKLNIDKSTQ